ncbi:hypothetical protein B0T22DRAFT_232978 [Podospora appendiculata]|uniref:RRM domain-containing protein n=1 Tax=Podospora appendiculata TaxID=314037 RepID=A0AAE0X6H1_9PEZI|nr:hypothetical protein B0T22DRAFT_232978 [Podospora appendiculata]
MAATKDLESPHNSGDEEQSAAASSSKKRKSVITEIEVDLTQPEPPSKKARRLLRKGKALPVKPSSDVESGDDEDKEKAAEKAKKKERSPYGVWIGNIRFTVTKTELRKWLVDNSGGTITDDLITRVHMPVTKLPTGGDKKAQPPNRGFAYVDFATLEANVACMALSETEWYRRKVLIKDNKSFEGRPKKEEVEAKAAEDEAAAKADGKPLSTKIFVGNLAFTTTDDDLWAHFEKCGTIRWVKVATFEDTGKCKGYGWVNFEESEAAAWAVKGFVKVRETIDTLEDFMEEPAEEDAAAAAPKDKDSDADSDDEAEDAKSKPKPKTGKKPAADAEVRIKTRKWWVNQLLGRNLKIELAEDDQSRYVKRFKKGGSKNKAAAEKAGGDADAAERPARVEVKREKYKKPYVVASDISVARLTGAPVDFQGKKTSFE